VKDDLPSLSGKQRMVYDSRRNKMRRSRLSEKRTVGRCWPPLKCGEQINGSYLTYLHPEAWFLLKDD
jgi:hypothetical protein